MNVENLPLGNGQEIYVEPDELYIEPEWIKQELYAIDFPKLPAHQTNPVYEIYKELFRQFYIKGYKVITNSKEVNNDAFFLTPCLDKHVNNTKEDYESKKNIKIDDILSQDKIKKPYTMKFPVDRFPNLLPSLPFVLKNEDSQGGQEKFLIKTPEQLEILKKFYNEINSYDKQRRIKEVKKAWSFYKDLEFDENGKSNHGISIDFADYKKEFHNNIIIQEYIETPTRYYTSLRVLTSSSGDILGASLKYSDNTSNQNNPPYYGLFDKYLSDPLSPYYLDSENFVSNTIAGGSSILLEKNQYSELEREILIAHNIDPDNATVPEEVMSACSNIAINCKREIGAICGLDFIYDEKLKSWIYLEEHEYPMLNTYAEKYNLPYDSNSDDFFTVNKLLDLRVRLHALTLTMQKKVDILENSNKRAF